MENTTRFINEKTGEYVPYPPDATEVYRFLVKFKVSQYSDPDYRVMRWSNHDATFVVDDDLQLPLPKTAEIRSFINVFKLDQGWNIPAPEVAVTKPLSLEERLQEYRRHVPYIPSVYEIIESLTQQDTSQGVSSKRGGIYTFYEALRLREFLKEFPEVFEEENMAKILKSYPCYKILFDAWESFDLAVTAREKKGEVVEESSYSCKNLVDFIDTLDAEMCQTFYIFQKYEEVKDDRKGT
jgi:hypothetical protein